MTEAAAPAEARRSRFWLYTPFVLLALVAVAWSVAWMVIRDRTSEGLDAWIAAEAKNGRRWTCGDRTVAGYPFRIEVTCATVALRDRDVTASLGRVHAVAQVYQPRHVITRIEGPLRLTRGTVAVEGGWRVLETSIRGSARGLQRASLVAEAPAFQVTGPGISDMAVSSRRFEAHLRPSPMAREDGAWDAAISALQARVPHLDALLGGAEPADVQVDLTATGVRGFRRRPIVEEIERWRQADGRLDVMLLSVTKGPRRIEAKGELRLDEAHRPAGELTVSAAGIEDLMGHLSGHRLGGNLLGSLLGEGARAPSGTAPKLMPLPPLRLDNGRLAVGPFAIPNVRLPALY
jgi:hypothetical protein